MRGLKRHRPPRHDGSSGGRSAITVNRPRREAIDLDEAAGEYGYDLVYFERMAAAGSVDVLQLDVSRCAGITEWLRAAAVAAAHGLEVSGHCAQSLHLHPACAVPNLRHLEYFADHARVDRLLFDGVIEALLHLGIVGRAGVESRGQDCRFRSRVRVRRRQRERSGRAVLRCRVRSGLAEGSA